jgi:hypothetical protein
MFFKSFLLFQFRLFVPKRPERNCPIGLHISNIPGSKSHVHFLALRLSFKRFRLGPKLHNLYSSPKNNQNDQVKEDEMGRACNTNEAKRNPYRIYVGKPEGKRNH